MKKLYLFWFSSCCRFLIAASALWNWMQSSVTAFASLSSDLSTSSSINNALLVSPPTSLSALLYAYQYKKGVTAIECFWDYYLWMNLIFKCNSFVRITFSFCSSFIPTSNTCSVQSSYWPSKDCIFFWMVRSFSKSKIEVSIQINGLIKHNK